MGNTHFTAAVWQRARAIELEARPRMVLGAHDVRIRVAACGICGSDLHEYRDGPHAIPVDVPHGISGRQAPLVIGHEFCGTVLGIGESVEGLSPGQRVAIEPEYRCGRCAACLRGDYNLCRLMGFAGLMGDGGMAEEAVVPDYMVHPLPDSVSFQQAAVLEPAAVALHAIRRSKLTVGDRCAIVGAGAIGLLLVQLARLAGAREIVVSDISEARLALALRLGATRTVNSSRNSLPEMVRDVDVAFEAVGIQATLDDAFAVLRKGGRLVLVGLFSRCPEIDAFGFVNREIDLISSVGYRDVFPSLIAMIDAGAFDPSLIVTRQIPLAHVVSDGFERLLRETGDVKILVLPGKVMPT